MTGPLVVTTRVPDKTVVVRLPGPIGIRGPQGIQGPIGPQGPQGIPGEAADHGGLAGLADDDHPQYLTAERANATYVTLSQRGVANGVATLDGTGVIPDGQIPAGIARDGEVASAVAALVASAPSTLDTLQELAAALGSDPNFATTITNSIASEATTRANADAANLSVSTGRAAAFSLFLGG